eukprot:1419147-Ditylum_brightwellii.AAC.1
MSPSQQPRGKPTTSEIFNSSFSRQQDALFSSNREELSSEQNATGYEANPVVQNVNLETIGPPPSQQPTAKLTNSNLQWSQMGQ